MIDEEEFNHVCWLLVSDIGMMWPPSEKAEETWPEEVLERVSFLEDRGDLEKQRKLERKYSVGYANGQMGVVEMLKAYGVDVYERAEKHAEENDLDISVPDKEELPGIGPYEW